MSLHLLPVSFLKTSRRSVLGSSQKFFLPIECKKNLFVIESHTAKMGISSCTLNAIFKEFIKLS